MAPTTFEELVAHQKKTSAALQKAHDEVKAFSDRVVSKLGVDWGDDMEGLRWRKESAKKYESLRKELQEKEEEVRQVKLVTARIEQTRARNMAEHEEIMEMLRNAAADDPWVVRGLREIIRAHDDVDEMEQTPI